MDFMQSFKLKKYFFPKKNVTNIHIPTTQMNKC